MDAAKIVVTNKIKTKINGAISGDNELDKHYVFGPVKFVTFDGFPAPGAVKLPFAHFTQETEPAEALKLLPLHGAQSEPSDFALP